MPPSTTERLSGWGGPTCEEACGHQARALLLNRSKVERKGLLCGEREERWSLPAPWSTLLRSRVPLLLAGSLGAGRLERGAAVEANPKAAGMLARSLWRPACNFYVFVRASRLNSCWAEAGSDHPARLLVTRASRAAGKVQLLLQSRQPEAKLPFIVSRCRSPERGGSSVQSRCLQNSSLKTWLLRSTLQSSCESAGDEA